MNCIRLLRSVHQRTIFHVPIVNYAMHHPIKFMETQDRWKEKDGIGKHWQLIYKAPMDKWINYATSYLTITTGAVGLGGLYYAGFVFNKETMNNPVLIGDEVVVANSSLECLVYVGAFVVFHVAVKILLSKYVIRLYQHDDNYLAIFRGSFFNSIRKHKFHLQDFKKLNPTFVVSWGDARFDIGKKHAIILENYFKTPKHFNYLLYKNKTDNPIDD